MKIYLVIKSGPEWSEVLNAYSKKKDAKAECDQLNSVPRSQRTICDKLSEYEIKTMTLIEGK